MERSVARPVIIGIDEIVGPDFGMQQHHVGAFEAHGGKAGLKRSAQPGIGFAGGRIAQAIFGGDAHAPGDATLKGLGDHRLAGLVAGGGVDEIDARLDGAVQGADGVFFRGRAPDHADAATARGEAANRSEWAQ
ncbi:hypothetical protein N8D56_02590 [Devosia sp. A8/3-2]|nr:hypothetical protein N8D56_02590 [Devosia sp. A8/3-2]